MSTYGCDTNVFVKTGRNMQLGCCFFFIIFNQFYLVLTKQEDVHIISCMMPVIDLVNDKVISKTFQEIDYILGQDEKRRKRNKNWKKTRKKRWRKGRGDKQERKEDESIRKKKN